MLAKIGLGGHLGVAFALVAAIVGATICIVASQSIASNLRDHVLEDLNQQALDINHDIDGSLGLRFERIRVAAESLGRSGLALDGEDAAAWTDALQSSFADVAWVALLDAEGNVVAASDAGPSLGRRYLQELRVAGQTQRSIREQPDHPGRYLLSQPLRDQRGRVIGLLLAEFGERWIIKVVETVLQAHGLKPGEEILVGDAGGRLLGHVTERGLKPAGGAFDAGVNLFEGVRDWPDGFHSLSVILPVFRSPEAPVLRWQVSVREDIAQADEPALRVRRRITMISALLIVAGAALGAGASLRLSWPLRRLARAAEMISEGRLTGGIPRMNQFREIVQLSDALRDMVGTLRSNEARLSLLNDTLASHIRDRDADFRAAHAGLLANESKLRAIIETAIDGVMIVNAAGIIEIYNLSCETIFGWAQAEITGRSITTLMPGEWREIHRQMFDGEREIDEGKVMGHVRSVRGLRKDGSEFPLEISLSSTKVDGSFIYVAMVRDISERTVAEAKLFVMATQDALTGVRNRRYFLEGLEAEVARCRRNGHPLSLVSLDADYFKSINDTFGHAAGDLVLRRLAETCRDNLREVDFIGRMGGEEFAIAMPDTDLRTAGLAAERLRQMVADLRMDFEGRQLQITMSIGIAALEIGNVKGAEPNVENLLRRADQALYKAKEEGRNRVALATS